MFSWGISLFSEEYLNHIIEGPKCVFGFGGVDIKLPLPVNDVLVLMLADRYVDTNLEVDLSLFIDLSFHLLVALPLMPVADNLDVMGWTDDIFREPIEVHGFGRAGPTMIISAFGT